jgi:hypothetical protein
MGAVADLKIAASALHLAQAVSATRGGRGILASSNLRSPLKVPTSFHFCG